MSETFDFGLLHRTAIQFYPRNRTIANGQVIEAHRTSRGNVSVTIALGNTKVTCLL